MNGFIKRARNIVTGYLRRPRLTTVILVLVILAGTPVYFLIRTPADSGSVPVYSQSSPGFESSNQRPHQRRPQSQPATSSETNTPDSTEERPATEPNEDQSTTRPDQGDWGSEENSGGEVGNYPTRTPQQNNQETNPSQQQQQSPQPPAGNRQQGDSGSPGRGEDNQEQGGLTQWWNDLFNPNKTQSHID